MESDAVTPSAIASGFTVSGQASFLPVSTTKPAPASVDPCKLLGEADLADMMPQAVEVGEPQDAFGIYGSGTQCTVRAEDSDDEREVTLVIYDGVDPDQVADGQLARMVDTWSGLGDVAYYSWVDGLYIVAGDTLATVVIDGEDGFHAEDEDDYRAVGEVVAAALK